MERFAMGALEVWKDSADRMPLLLIGARQVGKTWLMREFGKRAFENVCEVNFDGNDAAKAIFRGDYDINRILRQLAIVANTEIVPQRTLIIFDEVQECPRALTSLKYFCERAPEYAVAAAGSLLGLTIDREGGTGFPVGKVERLELYPLSFREFLDAVGKKRLREVVDEGDLGMLDAFSGELLGLLRDYLIVGGMPAVISTYLASGSYTQARARQRDLVNSYEDDVSKHLMGADRVHAIEAWHSIPAHLSRENKRFVFGQVRKGGRGVQYLDGIEWLCKAGFTIRVPRVTTPRSPLVGYMSNTDFKLFLVDVGLLGALCDLDPAVILAGEDVFDVYNGAMTEQYVCQQLVSDLGRRSFYWSSSDGLRAENDFTIELDGGIYAIEVKGGGNVRSKSLRSMSERFPWLHAVRLSPLGFKDQGWMRNIPLYAMASRPLWGGGLCGTPSREEPLRLSERQRRILSAMRGDPRISYGDLAQILGIGVATVARDVATMRDEHLISREGGRRDGRWVVVGE